MMVHKDFEIIINATAERVWQVLWNDKTYRKWTSVFSEGSYAETDWKTGSKALFLTPEGNGMVSRIKENIPNKYMLMEHLGVVENGQENFHNEKAKEWAGAEEEYVLEPENGKLRLRVKMDITEEYKGFFEDVWPKALKTIKILAEQ